MGVALLYTVHSEIYQKLNRQKEVNPIAKTHVAEAGCYNFVTGLDSHDFA